MISMNDLFLKPFSHLYIEEDLYEHPLVKDILDRFSESIVIPIKDYKDLFNRPKQDAYLQSRSKKLIIAWKKGELIYPGSRMCNDFNISRFYYVSQAMNCPFQCEYCYLQGMYQTSNLVIFINTEDLFAAISALPDVRTFIAISYDTDLLAIDAFTGFMSGWLRFIRTKPGFTFELRTKSVNIWPLLKEKAPSNLIVSFSLSPEEVISAYEHYTPDLKSRLLAVNRLLDDGYQVRLAFEPLLPIDNFGQIYQNFLEEVQGTIDFDRIYDVSVSSFHIKRKYLQHLRTCYPDSRILNYPYDIDDDISVIRADVNDKLVGGLIGFLKTVMEADRIFVWESKDRSKI